MKIYLLVFILVFFQSFVARSSELTGEERTLCLEKFLRVELLGYAAENPFDKIPKYWAQFMVKPGLPDLYLTEDEIENNPALGSLDMGNVDYQSQSFQCLDNDDLNVASDRDLSIYEMVHGNCTTGLICSNNLCSISPISKKKTKHVYTGTLRSRINADSVEDTIKYNDYLLNGLKKIKKFNEGNPLNKVKVINISMVPFMGVLSQESITLLEKIQNQDVINITWAAGNDFGKENSFFQQYPYSMIIPISSVALGKHYLSSFSNFGDSIQMSAPSSQYIKSVEDDLFGGTSGAAPVVAGALRTIHMARLNLSALEARAILKATAQDLGVPGKDRFFGFGMPNIPLATAVARSFDFKVVKDSLKDNKNKGEKEAKESYESKLIFAIQKVVREKKYQTLSTDKISCESIEAMKNVNGVESWQSWTRGLEPWEKLTSCLQFSCGIEKLNYLFLVNNNNPIYQKELCKIFTEANLEWGILNYCDLSSIRPQKGSKQKSFFSFLNDSNYYSYFLSNSEIMKANPEKWMEEIVFTVENNGAWGVATYPLSNPEILKAEPGKWIEVVKLVMEDKDNEGILKVLNSTEIMEADVEKWKEAMDLAVERKVPYLVSEVLSETAIMKAYPEKWKEWVVLVIENGSVREISTFRERVLSKPEVAQAYPEKCKEWRLLIDNKLKKSSRKRDNF